MSSWTLVEMISYSLKIPPKPPTTDDHKIILYNDDMEYVIMVDVSGDVAYEMASDME
jgi:hypothetical protein